MNLISDELRSLEIALRTKTSYDENTIKLLLKAHIDGITLEDILKVAKLKKEFTRLLKE